MDKDNKDYIVMLYGGDYISIMELLYDTVWYVHFDTDGSVVKLTRYAGGIAPVEYGSIYAAPRNQWPILEDVQSEWKHHLKNPSYRIPLKRVPAGWR